MTSQINPNNINGAYPVAGQDNNSQGFRDNFTNTSTNFQFAAQEITALQNQAILNSQLSGGANLTVQNNMLNSPLSNALVSDFAYVDVSLGTLTGTVNVNFAAGHYQSVTTGGNISVAFSNWPISGQHGKVTLTVNTTLNGSTGMPFTMQLPTAVNVNTTGVTGLNWGNTNIMHFPAVGSYSFTFSTASNGANIRIDEDNIVLRPFNGSNETLADGAAASLAVTTSYIPVSAINQAFTCPDGVRGQIKVFAVVPGNIIGGNSVVSVSNASWGSGNVGNITFSAAGDSCILQHGVGRWYVIGSNNATLS